MLLCITCYTMYYMLYYILCIICYTIYFTFKNVYNRLSYLENDRLETINHLSFDNITFEKCKNKIVIITFAGSCMTRQVTSISSTSSD